MLFQANLTIFMILPNPMYYVISNIEILYFSGSSLYLVGIDMLDGTPVLDIKPYIEAYDKPPPGSGVPNISFMADEKDEALEQSQQQETKDETRYCPR